MDKIDELLHGAPQAPVPITVVEIASHELIREPVHVINVPNISLQHTLKL